MLTRNFRTAVASCSRPLRSVAPAARKRSLATSTTLPDNFVRIVEVGPRDGLQNEKSVIPPETKIELIDRLGAAGTKIIEAGSFVSPKWVPQMGGTTEVVSRMKVLPDVTYQVLVPNSKGLANALSLLSSTSSSPPPITEIAIFTAATDAFAHANTNCSIKESLSRLSTVTRQALEAGLKVRGYVSVVITCPYSGQVDYEKVRDVTKELFEMGCYEVSLGDTVGTGTPGSVREMIETVLQKNPVEKLAGHFHDTFGMGVANAVQAVSQGIRTIDASVAGIGGCPYSPGATGNVATEDIIYALRGLGYEVAGDMDQLVDTGFWISEKLGRQNASRVANAIRAKRVREAQLREKEGASEAFKAKL